MVGGLGIPSGVGVAYREAVGRWCCVVCCGLLSVGYLLDGVPAMRWRRGDGLPAATGNAVGVSPSGWVWGVVGGMTKRRHGGRRSVVALLRWGLVGAAWHD